MKAIHNGLDRKSTLETNIIISMILLATLGRILIPSFLQHPANFSPIAAIALFSGAYFSRYKTAFLTTFLSIWISDIFIDKILTSHWTLFYSGFYWQYACYLLMVVLGNQLKNNIKPLNVLSSSLISSILFFIISNFGVWFSGALYPLNFQGLITCYIAAIPFFNNTLFSNLFFTIVLFGSFEWIKIKYLMLKLKNPATILSSSANC